MNSNRLRSTSLATLLAFGLVALLALGLAAGAAAQGAEGEKPPAEKPKPSTVPMGQITAQAEALTARLEAIEAERPKESLEASGKRLGEIQESVAPAAENVEAMLARRFSPAELENQATRWQQLSAEFESLESALGAQADALETKLSEMAEQTELWKRTLPEARGAGASAAALGQVERALSDLRSAKKEVDADLASTLALQEQVTNAQRALDPMIERIETAQMELAAGLLVRQDEPVWRSMPGSEAIKAVPGELVASLSGVFAELRRYAGGQRDMLIVHGIVFLVLLGFLARTRAMRDLRHPERAGAATDPLRHPWAGAFLIAALLTPFLQPQRVRGFQLVVVPLALVAWFRVLSGMLTPVLRAPLLGLALIALVELLRATLTDVQLVYRMLLIVDLAAGLGGVFWLRRPQRLEHIPWLAARNPWLRLLGSWLRIVGPALAGGLIAALLGYTSLADRVAIVAIWGTLVGAAWVGLVRIFEAVIEHVVEGSALDRVRMIGASRADFLRVLRRTLRGLALFAWLYLTLRSAGLWSPFRAVLGDALSASLGYGPVAVSLGGVIAFFLTLWVSWLLARFVSFALDQEVFSRVRMPPGVPFALSRFTRYAILVIGFLVAMGAIGFSLDRVTLLISALGVGIGFGLQNVTNNFVSGVILLFERPIRVGDRVQIDDLFGIVSTIGIRASKVRTFDGSDVIVPNGDFVSARVINWTLSDRQRRIILPVGVAYGTKPRRVLEILEEVARAHPHVLEDPAPVALFRGFGDSSLDFELRAFTAEDYLVVMSDLAVSTSEALEEAGISIPFPQRDLHLRNVPELRDALQEVVAEPRAGRSDGRDD